MVSFEATAAFFLYFIVYFFFSRHSKETDIVGRRWFYEQSRTQTRTVSGFYLWDLFSLDISCFKISLAKFTAKSKVWSAIVEAKMLEKHLTLRPFSPNKFYCHIYFGTKSTLDSSQGWGDI